jgi:hypothetical protein
MARPEEARTLYDRVASHGRLVFVPSARHGDLLASSPELYSRTVLDFIDECVKD